MLKNIKSVQDMGSHGTVTLRSPIGKLYDEVTDRFNYGIHHGRVSEFGRDIGDSIVSLVRKFVPGYLGKVIGGLCAIPVVAPTELVSGFHNVLIKKDDWLTKVTNMSDGTSTKPWSSL